MAKIDRAYYIPLKWPENFDDKKFDKDVEDYFLLFEDECSAHQTCAGRVAGLLSHVRDSLIKPPSHDPRNVVDILENYGDAHVSDSGWREVDIEEWFSDEWNPLS